jgi:signal peptidase I
MHKRRWICLVLIACLGCNPGGISSGDRVLVAKCLYESKIKPPERFDVVVFKFPDGPVKDNVPTNYIKRLMGLPGEIIAIFFGHLFRMSPPTGDVPELPKDVDPLDLWRKRSQPTHGTEFNDKVREWFEDRKFEIIRKPPEVMMAMRRIVNDNNFQPLDMKTFASRWQPKDGSGWDMAPDRKTFSFKAGAPKDGDDIDWLTYQHLIRPEGPLVLNAKIKPRLITDTMGYNSFNMHFEGKLPQMAVNWVGDLMLEATVNVTQPGGEFIMELNKGVNRFQARFDLTSGQCHLLRIDEANVAHDLGSKATSLRGTGSHTVRFANFDARLTVWVDRELPFGHGAAYDPPEFSMKTRDEKIVFNELKQNWGPRPNDIDRPASVGSKGAGVTISDLRLWRNTYYTMDSQSADLNGLTAEVLSNPSDWARFKEGSPTAFYVYPGHYMCLGDNSTHSSDSRWWGLVPERLMLGRALMVYYPLNRAGLIR